LNPRAEQESDKIAVLAVSSDYLVLEVRCQLTGANLNVVTQLACRELVIMFNFDVQMAPK
jgi:hypothetical protein